VRAVISVLAVGVVMPALRGSDRKIETVKPATSATTARMESPEKRAHKTSRSTKRLRVPHRKRIPIYYQTHSMEKRWRHISKPPDEAIRALSRQINVNPYLCTILLQRGIDTYDAARTFFRPTLDMLHDPFLMKGMNPAVDRLNTAIRNNERILIYGDYDVDGTTAVALVYSYLKTFYDHCEIYIPDR